MPPSTSQILTILLTDIKGFTEKTSHKSRADVMAMLEKHKELVLPPIEAKGGRLIKTIGDAFLVVFDSPTDAVHAGISVQEKLSVYNKNKEGDDRIEVRIAINSGEVTLADNDIFGDPVNITSRIEGLADAGQVYLTEAVYLSMNKKEIRMMEVGLHQLKGLEEKIRIYKVRQEGDEEASIAKTLETDVFAINAEDIDVHLSEKTEPSGVSASREEKPKSVASEASENASAALKANRETADREAKAKVEEFTEALVQVQHDMDSQEIAEEEKISNSKWMATAAGLVVVGVIVLLAFAFLP